jgi:hypothetical protein
MLASISTVSDRDELDATQQSRLGNADTCAALSAVSPLILITVMLERARISGKIRRMAWFRHVVVVTVAVSLIGTALSVVGAQLRGFELVAGMLAWAALAVAIVGLGATALMIVATDEVVKDTPTVEPANMARERSAFLGRQNATVGGAFSWAAAMVR